MKGEQYLDELDELCHIICETFSEEDLEEEGTMLVEQTVCEMLEDLGGY